jgi:uncharacterized protein involved in propanediol utilization
MEYSAKIYSRIGELMQGVLPDASAFLVGGLPSRRWFSEAVLSRAAAAGQGEAAAGEPDIGGERWGDVGAISGEPPVSGDPGMRRTRLPPKASAALKLLEREVGLRLPGNVRIDLRSNIPRGKGLSSSSTDILSVLCAANAFLGTELSAGDLYRIAARVEPTDPCLCDDIPVFYQHTGRRGAAIDLPPVTLIYFDAAPAASVDTLAMPDRGHPAAGRFFAWLLRRLIQAAADADYEQLFDAITYSAEYNQQLLPLPGFAELYRLAEESPAGLMVAHSGTIAGLLTRPEDAAELLPRVEALAESGRIYLEHYHSTYHQTLCTVFPAR